ncbi:hypothetical protein [Ensifer sp. ENS12]|uniref:hypothetical protein n=1 Tax=Ensifer sp. ENS12 TaxID=2854774 RepID=UPI00210671BA|nr:hypothetical protein [Ensifer sp. ENS12]
MNEILGVRRIARKRAGIAPQRSQLPNNIKGAFLRIHTRIYGASAVSHPLRGKKYEKI